MNQRISDNNKKQSDEITQVVIPPESPHQPVIPPEFNSPVLFAKDQEEEPTVSGSEIHSRPFSKIKLFLYGIVIASIVIVGIISIIQISISTRYTPIALTETPFELNLSEDSQEYQNSESLGAVCGTIPFVKILDPKEDTIFTIGDTLLIRIELCGIPSSLFSKVILEYFNEEGKLGEISLHCIADIHTEGDNIQIVTWQIPSFLETISSQQDCVLPTVNFLNPYTYVVYVEYANGLYTSTSDHFLISSEGYTYVPPQFLEYTITPDTSFSRSPFIDSSAPSFLQEVIFPAYFQSPPLFANYYRTYVIPQGPSYLIDLRDGTTYPSPQTIGQVITKPFSTLYITEHPIDDQQRPQTGQTHRIVWYNFIETQKRFEFIAERLCTIELGNLESQYKYCIPIVE